MRRNCSDNRGHLYRFDAIQRPSRVLTPKIRLKGGRRLVSEHVEQLAEHVSLVPEHMVVAFMPAPLYAEFNRKAAHLDMPVSILASTLLNVIATSDLYKAVLDD